ncbi:MAG: TIGR00730 family Rossman fold protein [Proteobacteria bacterium]|nr:TIGR00730 family Rossman fold protein [Pseudomonadota bacterium]
MAKLTSLCVYCGSSMGTGDAHRAAAARLGALLGERGIRVVFGGGQVGLMGILADAAMAAGGAVFGVIPNHLDEIEIGHPNVTELRVVDNMHARKELMFRESDAFAILPGGLGTMDETFEILTWRQLGLHDKPIIIVNEGAYWTPLLHLFDHISANGFARDGLSDLYTVVDSVDAVLPAIEAAPEPTVTTKIERL